MRRVAVLCGLLRQALQLGRQAVQRLTDFRLRAGAEAIQGVALLHQSLTQIEVPGVVDTVERAIGQRVGTPGTIGIAGDAQPLLAEAQQQFHFIQAQRLRAVTIAVGQLLHGVFEQRATLAQAQHFIAQHAVGGGRILQAVIGQALIAAQRFQHLLRAVPALLLRLRGLQLCGLIALPRAPAQGQRHASGRYGHDKQQPCQGKASRGSGHFGHSDILGRSQPARAPRSSATAWRAAADSRKLCWSSQFSKVAVVSRSLPQQRQAALAVGLLHACDG